MRRLRIALFVALAATVGVPFVALQANASASTSYSFNLIGPNSAENTSTGDVVRLTGSGSFDTTAPTVTASGSFTHRTSSGALVARGSWQATSFVSFDSFGCPNNGHQGGQLLITVTLFPVGGSPVTGVSMIVNCLINAPGSFTGDEGTTLDSFTMSVGGRTLFHLG